MFQLEPKLYSYNYQNRSLVSIENVTLLRPRYKICLLISYLIAQRFVLLQKKVIQWCFLFMLKKTFSRNSVSLAKRMVQLKHAIIILEDCFYERAYLIFSHVEVGDRQQRPSTWMIEPSVTQKTVSRIIALNPTASCLPTAPSNAMTSPVWQRKRTLPFKLFYGNRDLLFNKTLLDKAISRSPVTALVYAFKTFSSCTLVTMVTLSGMHLRIPILKRINALYVVMR